MKEAAAISRFAGYPSRHASCARAGGILHVGRAVNSLDYFDGEK
jgi:hypothetical protein